MLRKEKQFNLRGLLTKAIFIKSIERLIAEIEYRGEELKEIRQMTSPGSILESSHYDYLTIRYSYLKKRALLKKKLQSIGQP